VFVEIKVIKKQPAGKIGSTHLKLGVVLMGCTYLTLTSGCNREEIHAYRVPKADTIASPQATQPQAQQPQQAAEPQVSWSAPAGWQEVETTSSMRIATYNTANGLEVAVTAFPGDVGGLIANINRWRGQVGLDPTDEQGVEEEIERLADTNVIIVDIDGTDSRLLGSIINVGDGQTWFTKVIGPAESVGEIKADLAAFSKTFHIHTHDHDHGAEQPVQQPPANTPVETEPEILATTSGWSKPAEWTVEENASSILMAAYQSDSGARITLTSLVGEGGGILGNINRWRGQLGLPMVDSLSELELRDLGDGAVFVDIISSDEAGRMGAGIVPAGAQTLFFKLTGTVPAVEAELVRFEEFINAYRAGNRGEP